MSNEQLLVVIGVPFILNTTVTMIMWFSVNKRIDDLRTALIHHMQALDVGWREALQRVEGVIDARLKHLEER